MPTYISLFRMTQKGSEHLRMGPERVTAAKRAFQSMGAEIKSFFLVFGQYDAVIISEAPDDETIAKALLALKSLGYVRSETQRAFTEYEYRSIISSLTNTHGNS